MTDEQMAVELDALAESWRHPENRAGLMLVDPDDIALLRDAAKLLRAALTLAGQACGNCKHARRSTTTAITADGRKEYEEACCNNPSAMAYGRVTSLGDACRLGWEAK